MSYQSNLNLSTLETDADELVISGITDGIVSIASGVLQSTTLDDTLVYTPGNLVVNPDLEINSLGTDIIAFANSSSYIGIDSRLRFLEISTIGNYSHTFDTSGITLTNGPNQFNTTQSTLYLGTSQGNNWSLQTPSATSTITEIGSGTQTINQLLFDSAPTGISSWEISDTRSATHRGVLSYDHSTDIWYFKSVNSTEKLRIEPTNITFSQNLLPNGTIDVGLTGTRFRHGFFSGSVDATTGIDVGAGYTVRINGSPVLYETGLGVGVLSSSLTSVGTLSGGLNIASGQTYRINATAVLSSTTLGSGVTASSLTSVGTLTGGLNIATGQTYKVNGTAVLSSSTLGSGVTASSLTSLGNLTALNLAGLTAPTTTGTRDLGTTSLRFRDIFSERVFLYTNAVSTGTTLANRLNINGPAWASSLNYGISIGCPYNSGVFATAVESIVAQRSTTGGSFSVSIGNIDRNTSGVITADYSRNGVFAYNRFGVNMPTNTNPSYAIEAYSPDANIMRLYNASSQDCFNLNQSGTNTIAYINSTLAGGNNAYLGLCANSPNTPTARMQAFNTSTTTAGLFRISIQNGAGTLTGSYDMTTSSLTPVASTQDLGSTSVNWRDVYSTGLVSGTTQTLTASTYQRLAGTKGTQLQNFTTTNKNSITSPDTGALVYDSTARALSYYDSSGWVNLGKKTVIKLAAATTFSTSGTGTDVTGGTISFTARTDTIRITIEGGRWRVPNASGNLVLLGLSTTSGAQSYTLWDRPSFVATEAYDTVPQGIVDIPVCFSVIVDNLTAGTAYTWYLKIGSTGGALQAILYSGDSTAPSVSGNISRTFITYEFV